MPKLVRLTALVLALALVAAACDDGDDNTVDDAPPPAADLEPEGDAAGDDQPVERADPAAGADLVHVSESDLGEYLTDGNGYALYLFTNDEGGVSTCTDACATTWPPLVSPTAEVPVADGVDAALVGTIERDDGSLQVTFDGQPLYYFGGDQAPADQNGHGSGGVWFLVAPDGSAVEA